MLSDPLRSRNGNFISQDDSSESRNESRTLFLPEINLSGSLTTQNNNNYRQAHRTNNTMPKSAVELIKSSFRTPDTEAQEDREQSEYTTSGSNFSPIPQPPVGERKHSGGSKNRSRNITPLL